jgi:hypothetical protein
MTRNRIAPFRGCGFLDEASDWWLPESEACRPALAATVGKSPFHLEDAVARFRIGVLEREVRTLRKQLRQIRHELNRLGGKGEAAIAGQVREHDPCLRDVVRITQELFPGEVGIEILSDPEAADRSLVVFNVSARGSARDIVNKRVEWHQRVAKLRPGSSGALRLSIVPV